MRHLSDKALARLREGAELPEVNGGRYRLIAQAARGGMGIVYAAEDLVLQRRVALKVLDAAGPEKELEVRLVREAQVLGRLEHPGIVPVHDVGTLSDGRLFYTMKFVEGQRLDRYIESVTSTPDRLRIFLRICDAVAFAHASGVLHRDLKPANVMVGSFGEVLVMDWGLAKILREPLARSATASRNAPTPNEQGQSPREGAGATMITGHGRVLGTPGYMSPEQAAGDIESLDTRCDIYSLGALLRYLHREKMPAHLPVGSQRPLEAICTRACARNPEDRYPTVQELAADVSRYLDGMPVTAHPENVLEKVGRFYRRYQVFIFLVATYLAVRLLLLLVIKR